jgi:hypothetical protein
VSFFYTANGFRIEKDPDATIDYQLDWSDWLVDDDVLAGVSWSVATGLTQEATVHDDTTATVWVSGGTIDEEYLVTCEITTSDGRVENQSFTVVVCEA